jgi:GH15 family glucan-1,4-alpha-glucosidase
MSSPQAASKPIEDFGLIGNMISAALVGRDGSIDWLCLPRFDSAACFAALLGGRENGRWLIAPRCECRTCRRYYDDTAVLETRFVGEGGEVALIDFMPLTDEEDNVRHRGGRWLPEHELDWLDGYEHSRPVRVGNLAANQRQLDVYGELMDVLHAGREAQLSPLDEAWRLQKTLLGHLERVWAKPDHGIWETRGPVRDFTHSRLMSWVAFDRGVKSCERFQLDGPVDRWREVRERIREDILAHGFDERRGAFVRYYGGRDLDAALLLIPQVGFLPANDPHVTGTVAAIENELMHDGLVMRYSRAAEERVHEGAFIACTSWLADVYAMLGRLDEAGALFERLLNLRNDLGLLSEEYDVRARRLVGNFPQGFSHIGLVNTAFNLVKAHGPARQRSERTAPAGVKDGSARTHDEERPKDEEKRSEPK